MLLAFSSMELLQLSDYQLMIDSLCLLWHHCLPMTHLYPKLRQEHSLPRSCLVLVASSMVFHPGLLLWFLCFLDLFLLWHQLVLFVHGSQVAEMLGWNQLSMEENQESLFMLIYLPLLAWGILCLGTVLFLLLILSGFSTWLTSMICKPWRCQEGRLHFHNLLPQRMCKLDSQSFMHALSLYHQKLGWGDFCIAVWIFPFSFCRSLRQFLSSRYCWLPLLLGLAFVEVRLVFRIAGFPGQLALSGRTLVLQLPGAGLTRVGSPTLGHALARWHRQAPLETAVPLRSWQALVLSSVVRPCSGQHQLDTLALLL